MAERIKITYATLRNDNEELHALYDAGIEKARGRLGAHHQNWIAGAGRDGDGAFELRSPIDRDILVGTFARGTRQDVKDAVAAARAAQPAWRAVAVARAPRRSSAGPPGLISERQMEYGALMAIEVGKSRLEALGEVEESADLIRYYATSTNATTATSHAMDNLGDATVHTRSVLRPFGVFAVISPFNFPMALAAGPSSGALMAGNTVVFKPATASAMSGVLLAEAYRDAGLPDGVFNLVMGPGETRRPGDPGEPRDRRHRLHRLVRGRDGPLPDLLEALAQAVHRRDGRQEPGHRHGDGRPRGGGRGDHAQRLRLRRPEVLGQQPGLRRAPRPRRAGAAPRPEDGEDHDRRPARPRRTGSARSSTGAPSRRYLAAVAEARRDGRVLVGGERLTDGDLDRGFYVEPTVVGRPAGRPPPLPGRAVRALHGRPRRRLARRGAAPCQRQHLRPDGRRLQRGPGRGRALPRRDRGRRPLRQPRAPAPPPVPGRASSRSAAGRAPARPASPGWASTTPPSSCASRATRSSTDGQPRPDHRRTATRRDASLPTRPGARRTVPGGAAVRLYSTLSTLHNLYASTARAPRRRQTSRRSPREHDAPGASRAEHRDGAAGPEGPRPHRVRPRLDQPQPAAGLPDRPRARRGLRGRGHRRQRLPRLRRRHRGELHRPRPPAGERGDREAGGRADPLQRLGLLPADLRPRRRAARPDRPDAAGRTASSSATPGPRRWRPRSSWPATTPAGPTSSPSWAPSTGGRWAPSA